MDKDQLTECIPPAYTEYLGEKLRIIVYEWPGNTVAKSERLEITVSDPRYFPVSERRCIPVTRRCADCMNPLPDGTARKKYCNDNCRLRAFRKSNRNVTESITST